ncbi:MAG: hypothetical protein ACRDE2_06890, partial [Chitinophagaceae bacterium]
TSVYRGLVSVGGWKYEVPLGITDKLQSNAGHVKVEAYYLDNMESVYLYSQDQFLCEAKIADTYNYSTVERTSDDWAIMQRQTARQYEFMAIAKEKAKQIPQVGMIQPVVNENKPQFIKVEYDKLAKEEEEYASLSSVCKKTPDFSLGYDFSLNRYSDFINLS